MFQILSGKLVSICSGFDMGFALLNPGFSDRLLVETSRRAKTQVRSRKNVIIFDFQVI